MPIDSVSETVTAHEQAMERHSSVMHTFDTVMLNRGPCVTREQTIRVAAAESLIGLHALLKEEGWEDLLSARFFSRQSENGNGSRDSANWYLRVGDATDQCIADVLKNQAAFQAILDENFRGIGPDGELLEPDTVIHRLSQTPRVAEHPVQSAATAQDTEPQKKRRKSRNFK